MSFFRPIFHITVVEDSAADLHLIRTALAREERVELLAIRTGDAAMAYVQQIQRPEATRPDLLLLDLNLPGAHGHDVLRSLKAQPLTQSIPVVIITTSEDPAEMQRSYLFGASAHIVKPEDLDDYFSCIESICRFWRMSPPASEPDNKKPP